MRVWTLSVWFVRCMTLELQEQLRISEWVCLCFRQGNCTLKILKQNFANRITVMQQYWSQLITNDDDHRWLSKYLTISWPPVTDEQLEYDWMTDCWFVITRKNDSKADSFRRVVRWRRFCDFELRGQWWLYNRLDISVVQSHCPWWQIKGAVSGADLRPERSWGHLHSQLCCSWTSGAVCVQSGERRAVVSHRIQPGSASVGSRWAWCHFTGSMCLCVSKHTPFISCVSQVCPLQHRLLSCLIEGNTSIMAPWLWAVKGPTTLLDGDWDGWRKKERSRSVPNLGKHRGLHATQRLTGMILEFTGVSLPLDNRAMLFL